VHSRRDNLAANAFVGLVSTSILVDYFNQSAACRKIAMLFSCGAPLHWHFWANGPAAAGRLVASSCRIIGEAHNHVTQFHDPTAHAEIVAMWRAGDIRDAFKDDLTVTGGVLPMHAPGCITARMTTRRRPSRPTARPRLGCRAGPANTGRLQTPC
jgi:hypothetical protein